MEMLRYYSQIEKMRRFRPEHNVYNLHSDGYISIKHDLSGKRKSYKILKLYFFQIFVNYRFSLQISKSVVQKVNTYLSDIFWSHPQSAFAQGSQIFEAPLPPLYEYQHKSDTTKTVMPIFKRASLWKLYHLDLQILYKFLHHLSRKVF